jgi:hypothetical protein
VWFFDFVNTLRGGSGIKKFFRIIIRGVKGGGERRPKDRVKTG